MNYIELFAGCGGLSLGLETAGFNLLMANELSPMAAESYAFNLLNEDLHQLAVDNQQPQKTLWLNSHFPNLKERLRENPFQFPAFGDDGFSSLPLSDPGVMRGKLIVGSIIELNRILEKHESVKATLSTGFDGNGVDVISGGPPCQSFSMAGLRKRNCDKNTLPWEFAKFVSHIQPKLVLLENVTGILRPFSDEDGSKFYAWFEVAKTFASIGYVPLCLHVNARFVGVPQNRPRFIMLAMRSSICKMLIEREPSMKILLENSFHFFKEVKNSNSAPAYGALKCWDVNKHEDRLALDSSLLAPLLKGREVSAKEAIGDLKQVNPEPPSLYVNNLNSTFSWLSEQEEIKNHDFRSNSEVVRRRFRVYQVLQSIGLRSVNNEVISIMRGLNSSLSRSAWDELMKFRFLSESGDLQHFLHKAEFEAYLKRHPTKKQTQRALDPDKPAPAALSIPDDGCHYDESELRVFSVREMARIQSFPDNFVFRSKVTTGGKMRRFETPQYTQVGNAVPPLLSLALGKICRNLIELTESKPDTLSRKLDTEELSV